MKRKSAPLAVGQTWVDLDPRTYKDDKPARRLKVEDIRGGYAYCRRVGRGVKKTVTRIRADRFVPRRNGYSLVRAA